MLDVVRKYGHKLGVHYSRRGQPYRIRREFTRMLLADRDTCINA